jgi:tRNA(fMet)-specific endonuclease VapC
MTLYMLDTDAVSDMVRNPAGRVARRVAEVGETNLCVSIITAAELRYGAARSASPKLRARVEAVLARLSILPLDVPADAEYGAIRAELEASGRGICPNDLLIAAHASAVEATVVSGNEGEFRRVGGLSVENWISGAS